MSVNIQVFNKYKNKNYNYYPDKYETRYKYYFKIHEKEYQRILLEFFPLLSLWTIHNL